MPYFKEKYFSDAAYQSPVQFAEWSLFQDGIQIYRSYFFLFLYILVWAGVRDHVCICDHLATDPEKDASDSGWGALIFGEKITVNMLIGAAVIFAGIYLVTGETEEKGGEKI